MGSTSGGSWGTKSVADLVPTAKGGLEDAWGYAIGVGDAFACVYLKSLTNVTGLVVGNRCTTSGPFEPRAYGEVHFAPTDAGKFQAYSGPYGFIEEEILGQSEYV